VPNCDCGENPSSVQSRFGFSTDVLYVRSERHSCVICNSKDRVSGTVGYGNVVECDIRVNAVFTVV